MSFGQVLRVVPTSGIVAPSGVAWDGRTLWIGDRDNQAIMQVEPQFAKIIKQIVTPAGEIKSLQWVGRTLWYMTSRYYQVDPHTGNVIRDMVPI